ncbi:hypothetical protein B566_EDAN016983 [Ephemera danica]|nr:hypothetical protein B566_EDAN016983 [Ephemera danica]
MTSDFILRKHRDAVWFAGFALTRTMHRSRNSHTKNKPFKCNDCNASYEKKKCLDRHMSNIHGPQSRPIVCEKCKKAITRQVISAVHQPRLGSGSLAITAISGVQCSYFWFTGFAQTRMYEKGSDDTRKRGNFACCICHKLFGLKHNLSRHGLCRQEESGMALTLLLDKGRQSNSLVRSVTNQYSLSMRPSRGSRVWNYDTNSGGYTFACHYCQKSYPMKGSLTRHIKYTHGDGASPTRCNICNKTFKNLNTYHQHRNTIA